MCDSFRAEAGGGRVGYRRQGAKIKGWQCNTFIRTVEKKSAWGNGYKAIDRFVASYGNPCLPYGCGEAKWFDEVSPLGSEEGEERWMYEKEEGVCRDFVCCRRRILNY